MANSPPPPHTHHHHQNKTKLIPHLRDSDEACFTGGFLSRDAFKKFFMSFAVAMLLEGDAGDFTLSVEESAGEIGKGRSRGDRTWVKPMDGTLGVDVRYNTLALEEEPRMVALLSEEGTPLECLPPSSTLDRLAGGSDSGVGLYSGMLGGGKYKARDRE